MVSILRAPIDASLTSGLLAILQLLENSGIMLHPVECFIARCGIHHRTCGMDWDTWNLVSSSPHGGLLNCPRLSSSD